MKRYINLILQNRMLISACLFFAMTPIAKAQPEMEPGNLTIPIAPGDRELVFTLPLGNTSAGNMEVWVFYSKISSDLNTINSGSFIASRHYGRSIMLNNGHELECHFVFPHTFHSFSPNSDLFCRYRNTGENGLVTTNFPDCGLNVTGFSGIIGIGNERKSTVKIDFNPLVIEKGECVYYRIYKRVKSGNNFSNEELSAIGKFRMPDSFNIGIAGDSYGAGEGAPNKEFELGDDGDGLWISCPCHRSRKSGLLRGVKKFIDRNPEVAVDYSFTACSGAVTQHLGESEQVTPDNRFALYDECGTANNPKQFQTIRNELIGSSHIHDEVQMLIMSIGGNNSGFGDIVINYVVEPRNLAIEALLPGILSEYTDRIAGLDEDYSNLNQKINDVFSEVRPIIGITVYPDPTEGPLGRCGCNGVMSPEYQCATFENNCDFSPRSEYQILHNNFIVALNNKVRETNNLFGWHVIDNINSGDHGLCNCEEPYFNVIGTSYDHQGDIYGLVHPNSIGYREMYKDKVFDFVDSKYKEYKSLYYLAVLFGFKTPPSVCESKQTFISIGLNLVLRNETIMNTIPGLRPVLSQLNTKEIKMMAAANDEKQLSANPILKNLSKDVKPDIMKAPVSQTIIKPLLASKPLFPAKPFGKNISKVKSDLKTYLASQEFKSRVESMKKNPSHPLKDADALDNLYNKN